ncbi:hypothetical protein CLOSTMETH_03137 [[Clostridium] methylpentosum DSM 5476]|uniref:Uncharacterized protein n=1 Tax=[Clostridium] methylpentosum DSM 5476 TaxID=537013 RepID=C0EGZ3_9FIRM|nr:hypothetical protein CLOSTMETH_03137 [[Clostridium] methylpentosum DSM 5476]
MTAVGLFEHIQIVVEVNTGEKYKSPYFSGCCTSRYPLSAAADFVGTAYHASSGCCSCFSTLVLP